MGQSFFAISIGISIMVTYSSYLNKKESLPKSAITIVGLNLFVSLFAGLAIFPAVFSLEWSQQNTWITIYRITICI